MSELQTKIDRLEEKAFETLKKICWVEYTGLPPVDPVAQLCDATINLDILAKRYIKLFDAVKEHHDQKADDRCWMDDNKLYEAAGLPPADYKVGCKEEMLRNCERYVKNRCEDGGPWKSYAELEQENEDLRHDLQLYKDRCRHQTRWGLNG